MRAVIQRVTEARLDINGEVYSLIGKGLVILLGIEEEDDASDVEWLSRKIIQMRIFGDDQGKMNLSAEDVRADMLIVSQFTLLASTKKGNRPSFIRAAKPEDAIPLYKSFIGSIEETGLEVKTGEFGAYMHIHLINDGPVTIIIDSKLRE